MTSSPVACHRHVRLPPIGTRSEILFGNDRPFCLIAGPCQLESPSHGLEIALALQEIAEKKQIPLIFKSSFDKANRTSRSGQRGVGLKAALPIFAEIRARTKLPILTDIHEAGQCAIIAESVDILQIPAFLCRQTDLLTAVAKTGKIVNVKKGQFLAPWDVPPILDKITATGNRNILMTERGTSFGYNNLVNDMRALPIMAGYGVPVIFDATHSVQLPGGAGNSSGGQRQFVAPLARAAVATGIAGVFIETHDDPDNAPSDGPNMIALNDLPALLDSLKRIDTVIKG